jgi:hypothetical protein
MLLKVDSCQRNDGWSQEEYEITMKAPVKDVQSMWLRAANVPKSMYPFVSGLNSLTEDPAGTPNTVTIPSKNYTANQLATELTSQLTAGTITYDLQTGKLSFVNASGGAIVIVADSEVFAKLVGLDGLNNFTAPDAATTEFPNMVDLSWPRWLRLHVTVAFDRGERCMDTQKQFSYAFHFNGANFGEIEAYTQEGEGWVQREHITDLNLSTIRIKWELPLLPSPTYALDFNGVDHQLVFEVQ